MWTPARSSHHSARVCALGKAWSSLGQLRIRRDRSGIHAFLTPAQRNPPRKGTSDTSYWTNRRVTPIPKAKGGGMSAAELEVVHGTEQDRIEQWRHEALERAGYNPEASIVLAASHDIDLHSAVSLLERGCSVELALQILL